MNCSSALASLIRWRSCHRQSFQSRSVAVGKKRLRKAERADRFIRWRKVYKDRAYVRSRIVTSSRTSDRDRRSTVGLTVLEDAGESEHDDHNRDDDQQFRKTHRRAPLARYFGAFGGVAGGVAGAGAGAPEGAGAGAVAGVDVDAGAGLGGGGVEPLNTDPGPSWPIKERTRAPRMNATAKPVTNRQWR